MNSELDIAEGDVSLSSTKTAIMAHPPDKESDISLSEWIDAALEHRRAIKLDLKEIAVIEPAVELLKAASFPEEGLILNADALRGPGGRDPGFGISDLVELRKLFPGAVISIGSTIGWEETLPYRPEDVKDFKEAERTIGGPITFCLRVDMFLKNPEAVADLIADHHLTIWNSIPLAPAHDEVLATVKKHVPRGFIDLMDSYGAPVV